MAMLDPSAWTPGRNAVGERALTAENQKDFKRLDGIVRSASKGVVKGALALAEI
ncbi:MAG: hypothetical protein JJU29_19845 [Verrucomicrobia bacterium]|nr:hypothetical protein [Verrucomicrobiota bacterium]MCH8514240.1 hypothetical protein [Kiritimatiellia bacterium]